MWFQLAFVALLLALVPLGIVWSSKDPNKLRKLVWLTAFLTFDLIAFGAFTRLSDSGLGCPDWPGCYAKATPLQAIAQIKTEEQAMPTGPVTVKKAWIEMIHRYLAMMVGVLIIAITVVAWRNRLQAISRHSSFHLLATGILILVLVQGAFGAWTVTMKLQPIIVSIHLMLGNLLLLSLIWLGCQTSGQDGVAMPNQLAFGKIKAALIVGLLLLFSQIALGGWVSTNYAALACPDFPLCHGQVMPDDMSFKAGFELWRPLGKTGAGEYLPVKALVAIHWTHRMFALLVLAYLVALAVYLRRFDAHRRIATWLMVAVCAQVVTGMTTVFFQWPLAIALIHSVGAAVLVLLMTTITARVFVSAKRTTFS
jgi:heme a synthase